VIDLPNVNSEAECMAKVRDSLAWRNNDGGFRGTYCRCPDSSGGGGGGFQMPTAPYGSRAFGQQLAVGIVAQGLQNLFAQPSGPSPEEIARKRAEEEAARRAAEEAARRAAEERARQERLERERRLALAVQMKGADGAVDFDGAVGGRGGSGRLAGWKGLDDGPPSPPPADPYGGGTAARGGSLSSLARFRCGQYLADMSRQYASMIGGEEKARYYGEQSRKALDGQAVDVECPASLPAVPDVPEPTRVDVSLPGTVPELMALAKEKMESLGTVERALSEAANRKKRAEEKKRAAEERKAEARKAAEAPPPAGGTAAAEPAPAADADALAREAAALLAEAEAEISEAGRAEGELKARRGELSSGLKAVESRLGELERGGTGGR
jgi:hypothetical protein